MNYEHSMKIGTVRPMEKIEVELHDVKLHDNSWETHLSLKSGDTCKCALCGS